MKLSEVIMSELDALKMMSHVTRADLCALDTGKPQSLWARYEKIDVDCATTDSQISTAVAAATSIALLILCFTHHGSFAKTGVKLILAAQIAATGVLLYSRIRLYRHNYSKLTPQEIEDRVQKAGLEERVESSMSASREAYEKNVATIQDSARQASRDLYGSSANLETLSPLSSVARSMKNEAEANYEKAVIAAIACFLILSITSMVLLHTKTTMDLKKILTLHSMVLVKLGKGFAMMGLMMGSEARRPLYGSELREIATAEERFWGPPQVELAPLAHSGQPDKTTA